MVVSTKDYDFKIERFDTYDEAFEVYTKRINDDFINYDQVILSIIIREC